MVQEWEEVHPQENEQETEHDFIDSTASESTTIGFWALHVQGIKPVWRV